MINNLQTHQNNIYSNLITLYEYKTLRIVEPFRHLVNFDDYRIALAWQPVKNKPGQIFCPYCGCIHQHGYPLTGRRFAHCTDAVQKNNGYYLFLVGEKMPKVFFKASDVWHDIARRFEMVIDSLPPGGEKEKYFNLDMAIKFAKLNFEEEVCNV
jgi:hypothetical protein